MRLLTANECNDTAEALLRRGIGSREELIDCLRFKYGLVDSINHLYGITNKLVEQVSRIDLAARRYALEHDAIFTEPNRLVRPDIWQGVIHDGQARYILTETRRGDRSWYTWTRRGR